jgi:pyruvate formate lyase activating enzyme
MPEARAVPQPLEAASPFELRVDLGKLVPETDVRRALATGDMGFLHSVTTGATVDGPGVRVVAWTSGCMWRCRWHKLNIETRSKTSSRRPSKPSSAPARSSAMQD